MATMTSSAIGGVPYRVPREPNPGSSLMMALVVHAALFFFLWIGVSWQSSQPVSVEAEVWDLKTESAAAPPDPVPPPVRRPEPLPEPKPVPKVIEEPLAPKAPDIALERIKEQKKKLLEKKLAEEKLLKEKEKELAEQKAEELAALKAKEKADKLAKAKAEAAEQKKLQDIRDKEMKRIAGALGVNGTAEKSTAPRIDTGYMAAIAQKIKNASRYVGDQDVPGNPAVEFKIEQLPTGEIISVRKTKSSGIPAFDEAIERAINNSSPLPKKKDGTVVRSIDIRFKLKEFSEAN